MGISKKVILKYINDKDIGYSILSALPEGCVLRSRNQNILNINPKSFEYKSKSPEYNTISFEY